MADVIFVADICAFFALCVVYIRWCDRIIGTDEFVPAELDVREPTPIRACRRDDHGAEVTA